MGAMARQRRKIDRGLLVASLVLAAGLTMVGFAFATAETGRDAQGLPESIDLISPEQGDEVLRQTAVTADLAPGYEGQLVIDGRVIPVETISPQAEVEPGQDVGDDILVTRFDPGSGTLTYQPQEGAEIESFATGTHQVELIYWQRIEPDRKRSFTWQFRVTA